MPDSITSDLNQGNVAQMVSPQIFSDGASSKMPTLGALPGKLFLNEKLAPQVPNGSPRPFAPGEWLQNPNGSWSSEISVTVQNPDKSWSVVPSLWLLNGQPVRVEEDQALQYAQQSGLQFQKFKSEDEAEKFSQDRENSWQGMMPQEAVKVAPLWSIK